MARWERARNALPDKLEKPVLDLGCAFGFGTARLPHAIGSSAWISPRTTLDARIERIHRFHS